MIKYIFREDEPLRIKGAGRADPQVFGEALAKITETNGGYLEPDDVVQAAKADSHPLHPHFEWDDSVAAHAYRLDQARSIIRIVRVLDDEAADGTTRAFLSIKDDGRVSYRAITDVKSSLQLQLAVLNQAERDLDAFVRRYQDMTDICDLVRAAKERVADRRNKFETRKAA
jgi:hypothetical protein